MSYTSQDLLATMVSMQCLLLPHHLLLWFACASDVLAALSGIALI